MAKGKKISYSNIGRLHEIKPNARRRFCTWLFQIWNKSSTWVKTWNSFLYVSCRSWPCWKWLQIILHKSSRHFESFLQAWFATRAHKLQLHLTTVRYGLQSFYKRLEWIVFARHSTGGVRAKSSSILMGNAHLLDIIPHSDQLVEYARRRSIAALYQSK